MTEEHGFLSFLDSEAEVFEQHCTIGFNCCESLHLEYLVACFTFHLKYNARVFTCRGLNVCHIEFFEHLLARSGLLALGCIGTEAANEFLEFAFLLLGFCLLVLCLLEGKL